MNDAETGGTAITDISLNLDIVAEETVAPPAARRRDFEGEDIILRTE